MTEQKQRSSELIRSIRAFKRNRTAVIGMILLSFVLLLCVIGPFTMSYDPTDQDLRNRYATPSLQSGHFFGTDSYGRDVLSRVVHGTGKSLLLALSAISISAVIGSLIGIMVALKGGILDYLATEFVNFLMAFPTLLVGLIMLAVLGAGYNNLLITLSFVFTYRFIRLSRSFALGIKGKTYIEAARAIGVGDLRIVFRHILPNIIGGLVAIGSLWIAAAILAAAGLSFLGIGIQPPTPSLGNMVRTGMLDITIAPWVTMFPGLAILIVVLAFNMVGDGIRDAVDPRLRS